MATTNASDVKTIYWHRELPPLDTEAVGEYSLEVASRRVPGTLLHRDELWDECYTDLMDQVRARIEQEILRLKGNCAHVLSESVDSRRDDKTGEAWLHGAFRYVLYRNKAKKA